MADQPPPLITRRRLLATLTTAAAGAVAGCGSLSGGDETAQTESPSRTQTTPTRGGSNADIDIPATAHIDRALTPTLSGIPAGEAVTVAAETSTPGPEGPVSWSSAATFAVGESGTVALDSQAPVEGDYGSADPMGLVWAMDTDLAPERAFFPLQTHDVTLTVTGADDTVLTEATTTRTLPSVEQEPLGEGLVGTVHYPPSGDASTGVVLLHGSQARELTGPARLLAERGFVAATLQYFGEPEPIPSSLVEVPVEYVEQACSTLAADDRVTGDTVALYGASKGAELALLTGANSDAVGAVVSISGSGVVWEGIESLREKPGKSSWSIDGEPVPYIPYPDRRPEPGAAREYYDDGFDSADTETVEAATIPVERIDGPVQLFAGSDDQSWNSERYGDIAIDRLERNDFGYEMGQTVYDGAGHSITPPFTPTYGTTKAGPLVLGGSPAANATAAREHWPAVLSVLDSLDGS